jgi:hypothetical protein
MLTGVQGQQADSGTPGDQLELLSVQACSVQRPVAVEVRLMLVHSTSADNAHHYCQPQARYQ